MTDAVLLNTVPGPFSDDPTAISNGVLLNQLYFDIDGSGRKQLFVRGLDQ